MNIQAILIAAVVAFLAGTFSGWKYENGRFMDFKKEVAVVAAKQEDHVESVTKQQELVNKGIQNEYEGKLAALRNFYGRMQFNPSSGSMSGISPAPKGTDAETAYPILAGQCAETTLQVNLWQQWATENGLIK
jgi:hypothetical protein